MSKVTFIVTVFIFFAPFARSDANQAFLSGTEIVIDLKKVEIPHLAEMISAASSAKNNKYFSLKLVKEIVLNGQKVRVYNLRKLSLDQSLQFLFPWTVSVNDHSKVIEINGSARIDKRIKEIDLVMDN